MLYTTLDTTVAQIVDGVIDEKAPRALGGACKARRRGDA
jgi:hypothetical protein